MIYKTQKDKEDAIAKQYEYIKNAQPGNPTQADFDWLEEIKSATIEVEPAISFVKNADGTTKEVGFGYNLVSGEGFVEGTYPNTQPNTKTLQIEDGSTKNVKANYVLKAGESFV